MYFLCSSLRRLERLLNQLTLLMVFGYGLPLERRAVGRGTRLLGCGDMAWPHRRVLRC